MLDLKTCALKQLTFGMVKVDQVAIHPNGTEIAFSGIDYTDFADYRYGLYRYNLAEDKTRCVFEPGKYHIAQMVYLNDHKLMFVAGKHEKEAAMQCPEFMLVDLATDGVTLLCNQDLSVGNSIGSDCRYGSGQSLCVEGEKIYFISVIEDASCILSCDKQGTLQTVVANGGSIDMFDIKGDCIAYVGMHDMHLQEVYLYDIRQDRRPRCLTGHNDDVIKACPPLMPEKLQFQNANGDEIHGFVIKPANYNENEKYPAILDIHGGPRVAYGAVYFHEMQLWARMGYFVFFCNPTGSDGRGNKFWLGGRFGTIDYDDLMQFTDVVLEKYPQIDKKRVGVTGGSYGGFMTNWIIGHTNRFAAAASQRSIANNVTMELTTDLGILHASQQIYSSTFSDYQYVWNTSPLKYAGNVTTPTLFIHSSEDWRCGPAEGLQMYTALKFHGIETRLCLFMGENHELSRSGHPKARVRRLAEITAWMEQHLKATR
ncbi:MAG TPA: S9 family peptidase [Candidatus Pelethousia gallinarum]|nr:S9 family peptidase [Candidatus Pelethousia gallinarum]